MKDGLGKFVSNFDQFCSRLYDKIMLDSKSSFSFTYIYIFAFSDLRIDKARSTWVATDQQGNYLEDAHAILLPYDRNLNWMMNTNLNINIININITNKYQYYINIIAILSIL